MKKLLMLFFCAFMLNSPYAQAEESRKSTDNTTIELFSGDKAEYIARFTIKDGWHIYWSNPGEIGRPTTISSNRADSGLKILNQSAPQIVKAFDIIDEYVYKKSAYFHLKLKQTKDVELTFSFVECSDVCKPQYLSFDLQELPQTPKKVWKDLQTDLKSVLPQKINVSSPTSQNKIKLELPPHAEISFLPAQSGVVAEQSVKISEEHNKTYISWENDSAESTPLSQALVMTPDKSYALEIDYHDELGLGLCYILLLAFLGGLVLNAMPCVFPILSLKIFSLLKNRNEPKRFARALGYTLGVFSCFMVLTTVLVLIKEQGAAIGWGFQLQSPWFVGTMAVVFGILFLFMIDVLHFPNFNTDKTYKLSGINAFSTGFFAVLIASPCTGPFMGAAIGYAFMQSNLQTYAVFAMLALGYALPYALIELFPAVLGRILPSPGKWMQTVKYVLSVPLFLTMLWLFGILATQLNLAKPEETAELNWQPYDAEQISAAVADGRRVFIDFTADWCLTCQFNEKILLNTERFKRFVVAKNVKLFRADLTEDNEKYTAALNAYGRDGIPVYVYYVNGNYEILPLFFRVSSLQ
ncbi:MAG: thioredoxin family protein [Alphaproteobacteria bacterium]|nr:thioredoxin family protein [Alphaproteobacteria bacterium]